MPMHRYNYKRTNLFLLRVWCNDADENENGNKGEGSGLKWHGRLQRTATGEAHSFEGGESLIEALESMLYKDRPEHTRPPGNISS